MPIYLADPDVDRVVLVEPDAVRRAEMAGQYGDRRRLPETALGDDLIVAVPMATALENLARLHCEGAFGSLTFYSGHHIQNLDGFPRDWQGLPPMHDITQCALTAAVAVGHRSGNHAVPGGRHADLGSGPGDSTIHSPPRSAFSPCSTAMCWQRSRCRSSRRLGNTSKAFPCTAGHLGVEWPIDNASPMTLQQMTAPGSDHRGNPVVTRCVAPARDVQALPPALRRFSSPFDLVLPGMPGPVRVSAQHGARIRSWSTSSSASSSSVGRR